MLIPLSTTMVLATGILALVGATVVRHRAMWSSFCLLGYVGAGAAIAVEVYGPGSPAPLRVVFDVLFLGIGSSFVAALAGVSRGVDDRSRATSALSPGALTTAMGCGMLVGCAEDVIVLLLGFEAALLAITIPLVRSARDAGGRRAALLHVATGAIGLVLFVLGLVLLRSLVGVIELDEIARQLPKADASETRLPPSRRAVVAVTLLLTGLCVRFRIPPLRAGDADVHGGTNPWVAGMLSVVPRVVGTLVLLRLLPMLVLVAASTTRVTCLLFAGLGALLGGTRAVRGTSLRRVLAAAAGCHFSGVLAAIAVAGWDIVHPQRSLLSTADLPAGLEAALLHLVVHVFIAIGLAALLVHVSRPERPVDFVDDLAGLGRIQPAAAACLGVFAIGLVGLPPSLGFWSKAFVASALVSVPGPPRYLFAIVALLQLASSVLLGVVAARWVAAATFERPRSNLHPRGGEPALATSVLLAVLLLGLGLVPGPLLEALRVATVGVR